MQRALKDLEFFWEKWDEDSKQKFVNGHRLVIETLLSGNLNVKIEK